MSTLVRWLLPLFLALLLGSTFVQYLVTHPLRMSAYLSVSLLILFVLLVLLARSFSGTQRWTASVLCVLALATGWYVMTDVVMGREDHRPMPELVRQKGEPGDGHTAVIYLTHGEPAVYDPISWINQINEFDEQGLEFVPFMARPFFFYMLRQSYLRVGKSDHAVRHEAMLESLERAYREAGDRDTRFYLAFLDDNPRVGAAVINALNDGASRLVVSEVFVTVSSHTEEGEHQVMEMDPEAYGVEVVFTTPLWDSEFLQQMYVDRLNASVGDGDRSKIGVLLVAHGQPDEWDPDWPLQTEHEMRFGDRILERIEAEGYPRENLGKAWMSYKLPKPASEVERIHANGVERLYFFSYTISAAGMHSQSDIPALVHKANVPEEFPIVDLGAWGNAPLAIQAIKAKIDVVMEPSAAAAAAH
jgi:hypothetical protein